MVAPRRWSAVWLVCLVALLASAASAHNFRGSTDDTLPNAGSFAATSSQQHKRKLLGSYAGAIDLLLSDDLESADHVAKHNHRRHRDPDSGIRADDMWPAQDEEDWADHDDEVPAYHSDTPFSHVTVANEAKAIPAAAKKKTGPPKVDKSGPAAGRMVPVTNFAYVAPKTPATTTPAPVANEANSLQQAVKTAAAAAAAPAVNLANSAVVLPVDRLDIEMNAPVAHSAIVVAQTTAAPPHLLGAGPWPDLSHHAPLPKLESVGTLPVDRLDIEMAAPQTTLQPQAHLAVPASPMLSSPEVPELKNPSPGFVFGLPKIADLFPAQGQAVTQPVVAPMQPMIAPMNLHAAKPVTAPAAPPAAPQPLITVKSDHVDTPTSHPIAQQAVESTTPAAVKPPMHRIEQAVLQPVVQPAVQQVLQPHVQPVLQPLVQPAVLPVVQPVQQPVVQHVELPPVQVVLKPVLQAAVQPVKLPAVQVISKPLAAAEPVMKPFVLPTQEEQDLLGSWRKQSKVVSEPQPAK
jgi:hypothetical protein